MNAAPETRRVLPGGSTSMTVTGNLIGSITASPYSGRIVWVPASAQNYIQIPTTTGPTYIYASPGLGNVGGSFLGNAATQKSSVSSSAYFVGPDSASYTQGTASAGSGGSSVGY